MSDGPKWTREQLRGITTTGVNLLVSAAAGSGKTAVLSERCAYLVCDANPTCDVDQLLVVTFTEAAAAEMKGRIEEALRKRLYQKQHDARLAAQMAQIDRAQVGTLHGFCSRVLKQHFHLLELDPNFTILDGDEAGLLRREVGRALFADQYDGDDAGVFQKFIDVYGDGKDEELQRQVVRTHELLCSVIDPDAWIAEARRRIAEGANGSLGDCALGKELAAIVKRRLAALADRCAIAIADVSAMDGFGTIVAYLRTLGQSISTWGAAFGDYDFDALASAVKAFDPGKKPPIKKAFPGKESADAAVESVREDMGKKGSLFPLIRFSAAEWSEGLRTMEPFANAFLDLVVAFGERYSAAKGRARGIDFSDLERLTLKVLRTQENGAWVPSAVARGYQRHFAHVLVDEYQDINGVQEAILQLVSREIAMTANLFCVGDVKQSIYGFRLAEPARFLARYDRFKSGEGNGRVIDLQANFRSRGPLLDALNGLFERLMTKEAADLAYDESQKLRQGAEFPPAGDLPCFTGAPIELHLLPREMAGGDEDGQAGEELDRSEREASFIAARIHALLGDDGSPRMHVADKGVDGEPILRPIGLRDIVILLRSMVFKAEQIAEVLRRHGIRVHRDSGTGYFNSTEVRDMLALLNLLDNSQQDIPLATVLRSPLAGLKAAEDGLARIRLAYRDEAEPIPFHQAASRYAAEQNDELAARLRDFHERFEKWRNVARLRPLADLIWRIFDDTGYLTYCSGLENGEQRSANLLYLHERARQFGSFSRQGLYRFLKFLESLESESDIGLPSVLGAGEDVVRIMSVHRSKGLEFPVVFLPDLGKRINLRDSAGRVLVDRERYLGLPAIDEAKQVRYPSLASVLVSERLRQQAMAEELRVLYVATTRAKEHLILVGTCDAKAPERWATLHGSREGPLAAEEVLSAKTMLDWIGPVSAMRGSAIEVMNHSVEEVREWSLVASDREKLTPQQAFHAALKPLNPAPAANEVAEAVIDRLGQAYRYEPFSKLRATMAVTEWAKKKTRTEDVVGRIENSGLRTEEILAAPESFVGVEVPCAEAYPRDAKSSFSRASLVLPKAIAGELKMGAADKGTATHLVLEHLDFSRPCLAEDLREQIARMADRKLIDAAQAAVVDLGAIEWFVAGEVGQMIRQASGEDVIREMAFNLALKPEWFANTPTSSEGLDQVMLRGRIDLMVRMGDSFVVVDYKTDRLKVDEIEARAATYEPQVRIYRDAIEGLTGCRVSGVYLIFLTPRVAWRM